MTRIGPGVLFVLTTLAAGGSSRAQEPIDILKSHGLEKNGKFFLLPEEEKVVQSFFNMKPVIGRVEAAFGTWAGILQNEYELQTLTDYRVRVSAELSDIRMAVAAMPTRTPQEKYQKQESQQQVPAYEQEIRATNTEIALRQKRLVGQAGKNRAQEDAKKACDDFLEAKKRVWPDYEALLGHYEEIRRNDSVLNAIRTYNAKAKAQLKIGPSDDLTKRARQVIAYERSYSPETAPMVKKLNRAKKLDLKKKRASGTLSRNEGAPANATSPLE